MVSTEQERKVEQEASVYNGVSPQVLLDTLLALRWRR